MLCRACGPPAVTTTSTASTSSSDHHRTGGGSDSSRTSMEETVRSLLQSRDLMEGSRVDPLDLMKAYKDKLLEEMWKQQDNPEAPPGGHTAEEGPPCSSPGGGGGGGGAADEEEPGENVEDSRPLLERLKALETENSALSLENDNQRKQYERCLDEVANQVVQALLTQKDLKEECLKLRTRVFDLEQQNRILSVLFQQRVKMSTNAVSLQEGQRNGKPGGVPAGRWPSLLSLTCPRSSGSGSGSEASLSSAGSEYSSGSHTWAEGRGSSKQCATSREKRMSAGSVSSANHAVVPVEQLDLGWKEGHILRGLKRLQTRSPKEPSSLAAGPHYKDCMTSNEGIYSLGVKCAPQATVAPKPPLCAAGKPFAAGAAGGTAALGGSDSDDADDESPRKSPSKERRDQPTAGEGLGLEESDVQTSGEVVADVETNPDDRRLQSDPLKLAGNHHGHFLSPVPDNFLFEGPVLLRPGVSPTGSPTDTVALDGKETSDRDDSSGGLKKSSDRNNNQERSTDRKSRLDYVRRQQNRTVAKQLEADANSSLQHAVTRALSSEARQRSSSMDTPHCRDQASQASDEGNKDRSVVLESPRKKLKPQACDSARKAFILRSKSADGGPEQHKQLHSPLHQKLIKVHRPKGQSNNAPGHSTSPSTKSNLSKTPGTGSKGAFHKVEKGENHPVKRTAGSLESVGQSSPLSSPVKPSKAGKPPGLSDCPKSPTKSPLHVSKLPSSNKPGDVQERPSSSSNVSCSPLKQRRQEQHSDMSHSEKHRSPSPPLPPGRTTSLLIRPPDSLPKPQKPMIQPQTSTAGKATSGSGKPQLALQMQPQACDARHVATQMGADVIKSPKRVSANVYNLHSPRSAPLISVPIQESQDAGPIQSSNGCTAPGPNETGAVCMALNQNMASVSQQSVCESTVSEVLPQASSNVHYQSIGNNPQSSCSRVLITALPGNAKLLDTNVLVQGTSTFLVLGRHNKGDANSVSKSLQAFETFSCDPHGPQAAMRGISETGGTKDKIRRKIETRCSSLGSEPSVQPAAADSGVMLDWGFDEEGWLFKRSVSVSTRPPLKPVMGMNGAKARSQSFGARYMDRPNFNRYGKGRTQIKTHSGSSLNSLGDVFPGSMSCSSSYHCPMNRSLLNNFLIEEGLQIPSHLASSSERLQSLKQQREQARRLQIEQQFSSAFGEPVSEEPERQSAITTIEEKVMLGIEENLHKSQEQERNSCEAKQKSGSSLANWFGFRKSKLPAPSGKKTDPPKVKEEKKEQKITSLLGGKQTKCDKKKERRKSDGKDCSVGRREAHDAVRSCISMPCPGMSLNDLQGPLDVCGDPKMQMLNRRAEEDNGCAENSQENVIIGGMEPKKPTYKKSKSRSAAPSQKEQTRLQLAS